MPQQRHYAKHYRNALRDELYDELREVAEQVVVTAENLLEAIIRRTLRYSTSFGAGGPVYVGGGHHKEHEGLRGADVKMEHDVSVGRRGLSITLYATVVDPSGKPHFVWHLISEGRKAFVQKNMSPPIRMRRGMRTIPNTLDVSSPTGFSGKVMVIHAGTKVAGIQARQWYDAVVTQLKIELLSVSKLSNLNLFGIQFTTYKVRHFL